MFYLTLLFALTFNSSCLKPSKTSTGELPNILWIVAEDLGPFIPSFGDSTITTPHLSRLAKEGVSYDNVFSTSGVCAPSRAAIATGMYPGKIGANHMRTGPWFAYDLPPNIFELYKAMPEGIPPYEAILPEGAHMLSEYLRMNGYYCSNNSKEDYQFRRTVASWDDSSNSAHWKNRKQNQPFFSIFNLGVTHESQIWAKANDSLWVNSDLLVPVPPYLTSTDSSLIDIRRMYSNIKEMDHQLGELLNELEVDGLLENTIIFWYTDHGGPLPRQKRMLYDSGLRVPMIIRFPNKFNAETRDEQLISFVDLAPTVLSLCNIETPEFMDGRPFLGPFKTKNEREYVHAASDRFDESYDASRAVRDKQFKYIKNLFPEKPMFLPIKYREQMPMMRELLRLKESNNLDSLQSLWFMASKSVEELYDLNQDPHELQNLASNPAFKDQLERLRTALKNWEGSFEDLNKMPEKKLLDRLWPSGVQPLTSKANIKRKKDKISLSSNTPGAIIAYKWKKTGLREPWYIFQHDIQLQNDTLLVIAHRKGYLPSEVSEQGFVDYNK